MGRTVTENFIFVDVDGVLNNGFPHREPSKDNYFEAAAWIDPNKLALLSELYHSVVNARIVLSSTWRLERHDQDAIRDEFAKVGLTYRDLDRTPNGANNFTGLKFSDSENRRGSEIWQWLVTNVPPTELKYCGVVILDDSQDMWKIKPNLVLTDGLKGLTQWNIVRAIEVLQPGNIRDIFDDYHPQGSLYDPKGDFNWHGAVLPSMLDVCESYNNAAVIPTFKQFPSIKSIKELRKDELHSLRYDPSTPRPEVIYRSKPKLDGTNATIAMTATGKLFAQRRRDMVYCAGKQTESHYSFSNFVHINRIALGKMLVPIFNVHKACQAVYVYGEWCGAGIECPSGNLRQYGSKVFAIFAIMLQLDGGREQWVDDPTLIAATLQLDQAELDWIKVVPWSDNGLIQINFNIEQHCQEHVERHVMAIEHQDAYLQQAFGLESPGEGFVYYPQWINGIDPAMVDGSDKRKRYMFKARVEDVLGKRKVPAPPRERLGPTEEASAFAQQLITDQYLERLHDGVFSDSYTTMKDCNKFLGALAEQVQREEANELADQELTWKEVASSCTLLARTWFMSKVGYQQENK